MNNIPLFRTYSDDDDIKSVASIIERGSYWADGPEIVEFESKLAEYTGMDHAIAFNNGTSALHAMMMAYGIGKGDAVIVPSFTFISTVNSPLFTGARSVFADIESETFGMDPASVEDVITDRTRAIMPVHYGGHPCKIGELRELAEDKGLLLFEDAAESLGSKFDGQMIGTFGDTAMFSFCQNKIISTGEGGILVTNDPQIAMKLKLLRSHGRSNDGQYFTSSGSADYIQLGHNLRMPTMCAALGISQLAKIEQIIDMRRSIAHRYSEKLDALDEVRSPIEFQGSRHVYQLYSILLDDHGLREGLKEHLGKSGIMSKVYFDPVHLTGFYKEMIEHSNFRLPVTEDIASRTLTLPLYPGMNDGDVERVINTIKEYLD